MQTKLIRMRWFKKSFGIKDFLFFYSREPILLMDQLMYWKMRKALQRAFCPGKRA
jgi:hypothetical protein